MLVEFRFSNYKSFRDESTLSLVASSLRDLPENTFDGSALGKGRRLLNGAIVYGPNASGKSNLIEAVNFVKQFVLDSADRSLGKPIPVKPFALDEAKRRAQSEFEVTFVHEGVRFQYGFVVDRARVYEEWLIAYPHGLPQTWFTRELDPVSSETAWYFGPNLKGEKSAVRDLTRDDVLFLSVAAKFNQEQLTHAYNWFQNELLVIPASIHWFELESTAVRTIRRNDDIKEGVIKLLKMADFGITGLVIKDSPVASEDPDDDDMPVQLNRILQAMREAAVEDGVELSRQTLFLAHNVGLESQRTVLLGIDDESVGTRRMLTIAVPVLLSLARGGVLVIDEVDSSLHPVLVRRLFEMFADSEVNAQGAQLIFNTHDVTLLDAALVRRDQVWFTEKDHEGSSHLYSLVEFKPRKSEALEKNYLQGRYGAIPVLSAVPEGLVSSG